jgi:hypothetical protein
MQSVEDRGHLLVVESLRWLNIPSGETWSHPPRPRYRSIQSLAKLALTACNARLANQSEKRDSNPSTVERWSFSRTKEHVSLRYITDPALMKRNKDWVPPRDAFVFFPKVGSHDANLLGRINNKNRVVDSEQVVILN